MKTIKFTLLATLTLLFFTACENDNNPDPVNEEEVITTLTARFTPQGGGNAVTLMYRDLDGDGPNDPTITVSGNFANGTVYSGSIELLNETETPAEDITEEIQEEDDEHQFFYALANSDIAMVTYTDEDGDGNPVGLTVDMETTARGTTTLTMTLRHEPNKNASGVSDGNIANAGGETDIEVTFTITVE